MRHGLERAADLGKCDPLHVRAEIAGTDELDAGVLHGDVVAHRTFGHQHDPRGPFLADIVDHRRRRAGEVRFGHDLGRALGMGQHDDAGVTGAQLADVVGGEALMDLAVAGPGDDLDGGLARHVLGECLLGPDDLWLRRLLDGVAPELPTGQRQAPRAFEPGEGELVGPVDAAAYRAKSGLVARCQIVEQRGGGPVTILVVHHQDWDAALSDRVEGVLVGDVVAQIHRHEGLRFG